MTMQFNDNAITKSHVTLFNFVTMVGELLTKIKIQPIHERKQEKYAEYEQQRGARSYK